ncbi:MAG: hypothetical protein U0T83_06470 [Bacteriovoracaceae bacterium]
MWIAETVEKSITLGQFGAGKIRGGSWVCGEHIHYKSKLYGGGMDPT